MKEDELLIYTHFQFIKAVSTSISDQKVPNFFSHVFSKNSKITKIRKFTK